MKYNKVNYGLMLLIIFSISNCSNDDTTDQENRFYYNLNHSTLAWLSPFDQEGKKMNYINGSNETSELEIDYVSELETEFYIDCQVNNNTVQCELESVVIKFPEESQVENYPIYITILLMGEDQLRIMPSNHGGSITQSAAKYYEDSGEIVTSNSENFNVTFDPEFEYKGETSKAIIIETLSIENLATGGIIPPKKLILVKGIGIVEWDDYENNTWIFDD